MTSGVTCTHLTSLPRASTSLHPTPPHPTALHLRRNCPLQVVLEKAAADKGQPPPPPDAAARAQLHEWEQRLTEQVRAEAAAAEAGGEGCGVEVLVRGFDTDPVVHGPVVTCIGAQGHNCRV